MTKQLTWRPATAADTPLLLLLFCSTKGAELAPLGFTAEQLEPLLQMQFRARQLSYGATYPHALDMMLCLADGTPVGRHLVDRQPDCYRSVDLAVLPEQRGQGIGTWALQQVMQLCELEQVPLRLRAITTDRAVQLYARLGFQQISQDEMSVEMEWRPARLSSRMPAPAKPEAQIMLRSGHALERSHVIDTILSFLRELGLQIELLPVPDGFLPGIRMIRGGLRVDLERLLYPGDLLHEAGHLAVMPRARRMAEQPASTTDGGEEMAALAWSYAAAMNLALPPEVVFHDHGYKGQAQALIARYQNGDCPGVPLLWWMGLTTAPAEGRPSAFPRMTRWLCEEPPSAVAETAGFQELQEVHA